MEGKAERASRPWNQPAPPRPPSKPASSAKGREDPQLAKLKQVIAAEILDASPGVAWADVAGLEEAKRSINEMVILPAKRADLYQGLRAPPKGLLLFGPPGTGKTMIAKAAATEAKSTFFAVSASSLTSKWLGESEKLVRALFTVARERAPSIIFLDEIDSVLSSRSTSEHEASRRLKTEFLVQMDGIGSGSARVVVLAATNRPMDLDEALLRRLPKRIYVPLPDTATRLALLVRLLRGSQFQLQEGEMASLVRQTDGYSCSDITALCHEAALQPLRELGDSVSNVPAAQVRTLTLRDFEMALRVVRPSVQKGSLDKYQKWDSQFGVQSSGASSWLPKLCRSAD